MKRLKPGDLLCVKSIDRLGRDYQEIIEQWRVITKDRQAEGIASAKARGVRFGRKKKELPEDFEIWFVRWRSGEITGKQMADHCGMEISVLYRKLREAGISLN